MLPHSWPSYAIVCDGIACEESRGSLLLLSDAYTAHHKIGVVLTYCTSEPFLFFTNPWCWNSDDSHGRRGFLTLLPRITNFSLSVSSAFLYLPDNYSQFSLEPPSFFWLLLFLWHTEYYEHVTFDKFQIQCFGKWKPDFSHLDAFPCKSSCPLSLKTEELGLRSRIK